jgi:DNA-binding MarR family transcriptional regulator
MSSIMRKSVDPVNQTAETTPEQVFEAVHAVMHLYRAQSPQGRGGGGQPLTHMEHKVLAFFAHRPGATQSDLAAHSGRDKGQLARLVAGLKERGLLQAQVDEVDRRSVHLTPTAQARTALQAAQRQARRVAAVAVAGLADAERAQLLALLQRIRSNLEGPDS